jgi:DNA-binding CsgD family transcriptional regulator
MSDQQHDAVLTQREREVLALVGRGLTNQEIAEHLFTSTSTVKLCLHRACVKMKARNRAQAVILAMKRGLLGAQELYSLEELAELLAALGPEAIETVAALLKGRVEPDRLPAGIESSPLRPGDRLSALQTPPTPDRQSAPASTS